MNKSTSNKPAKRSTTVWLLLLASLLYFVLLALPNATGARDVDMLSIFEVDEYAQYEHVVRMVSGGESLVDSLRKFVAYEHYFYGYPFYFFSAVSILPLRWLLGADLHAHTATIVLVLRQLINVAPNLLSVWLLTYTATQFRSVFKTIVIFALLLLLPALMGNSLWWHADGLALLFMALGFFLLRLDGLRFQRYFWLAAAAAGVGLGIKYIGALFVLVIPLYLSLGVRQSRLSWRQAAARGLGFVAIMLAVFVLTNPLLLLPQRADLIANQRLQFEQTSQGIFASRPDFLEAGRLPGWLTANFGTAAFLALLAAALAAGWLQGGRQRAEAALLAAWLLPNLLVMLNASSMRVHYWLQIFMPAMMALVFILPDKLEFKFQPRPRALLQWAALLLIAVQAGLFAQESSRHYQQTLHREDTSPSLQFYRTVHPTLLANGEQHIYRDWKVYFPSDAQFSVFLDWELGSHDMLAEEQPDVLLLERENVEFYGAEDYLDTSPDPGRLEPMHRFYRDALQNQIPSYTLVYEDAFGLVFVRQQH